MYTQHNIPHSVIASKIFPVINGTITPSFKLAPVLAHRFEEVPWKQGFVASDPFPNEATKEYVTVADFTTVIETIAHNETLGIIDDAHLYEIISEHRPVETQASPHPSTDVSQ